MSFLKKKIVLPLMVALLILPLLSIGAFAADYSVSLSLSKSALTMCPGATEQLTATVKNTGTLADTFTLSANSAWVTIAPASVSLAPGEEKTAYVYVTPDYAAEPKTYSLEITAAGQSTKKAVINLELQACYGISLTPTVTSQEGCVGEALSYEIEIKNSGAWTDTFDLSATAGALSQQQVTLTAGENKTITLTVGVEETKTIEVKAQSTTSPAGASVSLEAKAKDCWAADLKVDMTSQTTCAGERVTYLFTLENTGEATSSFDLNANIGNLSVSQTELAAGESKNFTLILTPDEVGTVESIVTASSPYINLTKKVTTVANYCQGVAIITEPLELETCGGTTARFTIILKNIGTTEDSFSLQTTAGTLEQNIFTLKAGEIKSTHLEIDTKGLENETSFIATATSVSDTSLQDSASGKVIITECYTFDLSLDKTSETVCPGGRATFTLTVENTGKLDDVYAINTSAGTVAPASLEISAGGNATAALVTAENATITVASPYVEKNVSVEVVERTRVTCWGFTATPDEKLLESNESRNLFTITVTNAGEEEAGFTIQVDGPDWALVAPKSFSLEKNASQDVFVYMSPPFNVSDGIYSTALNITSDKGLIKEQKVYLAYGNVTEEELAAARAEIAAAEAAEELIEIEEEEVEVEEVEEEEEEPAESFVDKVRNALKGAWASLEERLGPKGTVALLVIVILGLIVAAVRIIKGHRVKGEVREKEPTRLKLKLPKGLPKIKKPSLPGLEKIKGIKKLKEKIPRIKIKVKKKKSKER